MQRTAVQVRMYEGVSMLSQTVLAHTGCNGGSIDLTRRLIERGLRLHEKRCQWKSSAVLGATYPLSIHELGAELPGLSRMNTPRGRRGEKLDRGSQTLYADNIVE